MPFFLDEESGISRVHLCPPQTHVTPISLLICASVGAGKTLASEQILHYYYRHGYTIISLSDQKDSLELAFSMFEPEAPYHLRKLKRLGCPIEAIPTKIYHPFTFNIPHHPLPPINFYTINIKTLNRTLLQFLAETNENKRSIQIIMETLENLKKNEGLHHLVYYADEKTESTSQITRQGVRLRSDNPDDFYSRTKMGTEKTSSEINSYLKPFIKSYTLTPQSTDTNLDILDIMNDQKHYHIFTYKYEKDDRLKKFYLLHNIEQIINHADQARHPILLYIGEIRHLTPNTNEGFNSYLAESLKQKFTIMRNMGKGFSIVTDTQVYRDVHPSIIDSMNENIFGRITSLKEIEFISKALRLTTQEVNLLKSLQVGEFIIKTTDQYTDEPNLQKIHLFLPPAMHAEVGYNFFQTYAEKHPDKLQTYTELTKKISNLKNAIQENVSILKDAENQKKRDQIKKQQEEKNSKTKNKIDTETLKLLNKTAKAQEITDNLKQLIYQDYTTTTPQPSLADLAHKYKLYLSNGQPNKMAIKRAIQHTHQKTQENDTPQNNQNQ